MKQGEHGKQKDVINMQQGPWRCQCAPQDGARITRLDYAGTQLLSGPQEAFTSPPAGIGAYEQRPVFGYDDCFPTVDACRIPDIRYRGADHGNTENNADGDSRDESRSGSHDCTEEEADGKRDIPDHGDLYQLPWHVTMKDGVATARAEDDRMPVSFERTMVFREHALIWQFSVNNHCRKRLPFLHVMHALLPSRSIAGFSLPACGQIQLEHEDRRKLEMGSDGIAEYLRQAGSNRTVMLLLRHIAEPRVSWQYENGPSITMKFPGELFPTVGVWWNHGAHPAGFSGAEPRYECAFEPIPGTSSSLEISCQEGFCLKVKPFGSVEWEIVWEVSR